MYCNYNNSLIRFKQSCIINKTESKQQKSEMRLNIRRWECAHLCDICVDLWIITNCLSLNLNIKYFFRYYNISKHVLMTNNTQPGKTNENHTNQSKLKVWKKKWLKNVFQFWGGSDDREAVVGWLLLWDKKEGKVSNGTLIKLIIEELT